jgi:hypothetical protein
MDAIKNSLSDPSWWFTAVVVAIFASLAGSFVRDGLSWLFSKTFDTVKDRRLARMANTQTRVDFLSRHANMLIIEYIRVSILFSAFLASSVLFLNAFAISQIAITASVGDDRNKAVNIAWLCISIVLGMTAVSAGYFSIDRLRVAKLAAQEYRKGIEA